MTSATASYSYSANRSRLRLDRDTTNSQSVSEHSVDMDEEMQFHIEQYRRDLVRGGVAPAVAARRARQEFGAICLDCLFSLHGSMVHFPHHIPKRRNAVSYDSCPEY